MKNVSKERKTLALKKLNASKKAVEDSKIRKGLKDMGYEDDEIDELLDSFKKEIGLEISRLADDKDGGGLFWAKNKDGKETVWEAVGQKKGGFRWYDVTENLSSSKKLNSAKQVEGEWFYSLTDVEDVVAAVLAELDKDNGAAITLSATETGISLDVTSSEGEEFSVPVDLGIEGDEAPAGEIPMDEPIEDEPIEE